MVVTTASLMSVAIANYKIGVDLYDLVKKNDNSRGLHMCSPPLGILLYGAEMINMYLATV